MSRWLHWSVALALAAGCATPHSPQGKTTAVPAPKVPEPPVRTLSSDEEYQIVRGDFDGLVDGDAGDAVERRSLRRSLIDYQVKRAKRSFDLGRGDDAYDALKQMMSLYEASELVSPSLPQEMVAVARKVEERFRRQGAVEETLAALVVEVAAGDRSAEGRYASMDAWISSGEDRDRMEDALSSVVRLWPSPFVVDKLAAVFGDHGGGSGLSRRRMSQNASAAELRALLQQARLSRGSNLARLYLRVSRPKDALQKLRDSGIKSTDDESLEKLLAAVVADTALPKDWLALVAFLDGQAPDRPLSLRLCLDGERRFPKSPELKLCSGEVASALERLGLAMRRFEEVIQRDPQKQEPWQLLARIYQTRLYQLASDENVDLPQLERELAKVEKFFDDGKRLFGDKPMVGAMAGVLFEVGRGYYNAGKLKDAVRLLERSLVVQATPPALELYGQLELKRGRWREALGLLERVSSEPQLDPIERIYWRARARRMIADAQEAGGDGTATATRRAAVGDWEVLLGNNLRNEIIVEALLEKGKLFYQLGDREPALEAWRKSVDLMPDRSGTYAELLAFLVPRGELEEALDVYHRALGREEVTDYLKVYCSLWVLDLARRGRQPEDPLALNYLRGADGTRWFDDLARWATGRQTDAAMAERATTPGRRAELAYYRAMRALENGKTDEAETLWKAVVASDMMAFFEYDMATLFLRWGNAPTRPLLAPAAPPPKPAKSK